MKSELKTHICLYFEPDHAPDDTPLAMRFEAEDASHAREQMLDAEPQAHIVLIHEGDSLPDAQREWLATGKLRLSTAVLLPAWVVEDFGEKAAQDAALAMVLVEAEDDRPFTAAWSVSCDAAPCFVGMPPCELQQYRVPLVAQVSGPPGIRVKPVLALPSCEVLEDIEAFAAATDSYLEHVVMGSRLDNTHIAPLADVA